MKSSEGSKVRRRPRNGKIKNQNEKLQSKKSKCLCDSIFNFELSFSILIFPFYFTTMNTLQTKQKIFARRKARIRAKIHGTIERPRLAIFKSHKYIYVQVINDDKGQTLASFDSRLMKTGKPIDRAKQVGVEIAKKAKAAKVTKVVFDRGGYLYTGQIKVVADAAREGGLEF